LVRALRRRMQAPMAAFCCARDRPMASTPAGGGLRPLRDPDAAGLDEVGRRLVDRRDVHDGPPALAGLPS
jgi:hypothetical protein